MEAAVHHDVSPPLTLMIPAPRSAELIEHEVKPLPNRLPGAALASRSQRDLVHQSSVPLLLMPTASANFDGIGQGFGGFNVNSAPPDTNGDVGPNHYVQTVNSDYAVLNKTTGAIIFGPVTINTLWSGFGGGCQTNNDGDPIVKYDKVANRWIITQFSVTGANGGSVPFLQCVAVSTTPDPTGSYNRYSFPYSGFNDYPKLAVWPDAYYITFNIFNAAGTSFLGGKVCAYDRSAMLAGAPATQQCFDASPAGACPNAANCYGGLLTSDVDGATAPPSGSPNYVLALGATTSTLALWKFHVDFAAPANSTLTGPTEFSVSPYTTACGTSGTCIPQLGTSQQLDSLSDRLMFRLAYRNFVDHEALVVNHSVTAGATTGVRWYEIRLPGGTPTLFQEGTYSPDANHRWMGSMAMDRQGNMGLGFSKSSSSIHPQVHYTGRLVGDVAGTMSQGEAALIDGAGSQGTSLKRWGDYSMMSVDPVDDCTFYFTTEYLAASGTFNWHTRVGSFKFPGCGGTVTPDFTISANPTSLTLQQNTSGTSTISTTVVGAGGNVALAVSGVPSGATASLNPTSVTAGGSSTLTISAGTAAPASYTITVTGTEGAITHSTTVALTVTTPAAADFTISASPSSLTLVQNTSGTSTISTTQVGSAGTVGLSASVSPSGPSVSLSPTSVAAGASATLTVNAGASAPGSYTVTVTGTEGAAVHSTTVALSVTAAGSGGGITNGGFETGSLSGWTAAGTTAVIAGGAHSGTYSARVGGTTPTNGDSSIAQTFTAPAGSSSLSFWYKVVCPDTLTYDWATATLRNNATGVVATVLPKVCSNNGTWQQSAATALTGGTSYTLTLISHDDNWSSDPTYTLYDDVAIASAAPADFTISANPSSLSLQQSTSGTSTISTTRVGSAGTVNLAASVSPAGPLVTVSPASVAAGASSTLTVSAGTAALGSYTITVTGTEGSFTHSTTVALTVTAPPANDFTISASPTSLSLVKPAAGSSTIATTVLAGSAATVSLSVSGAPAGASASVSPTSVTAGGSSTLTVDPGTATAGTYTITVTGDEGGKTHSTTVTVTITEPVAGGIVNGGFEAGSFSGWTTAGAATSISTTPHSGVYAAQAGSTSPTNGDSTISQTFTAPTGVSTISVWYNSNCPDSVTYDWAQITLVDNTASTTTDLLAPACAVTATWTQVTGTVIPGHSYTIRLLNHDDNWTSPPDPTYTLFDDVTLQ